MGIHTHPGERSVTSCARRTRSQYKEQRASFSGLSVALRGHMYPLTPPPPRSLVIQQLGDGCAVCTKCVHSAHPFRQLHGFHPPNKPSQKAPRSATWAGRKQLYSITSSSTFGAHSQPSTSSTLEPDEQHASVDGQSPSQHPKRDG